MMKLLVVLFALVACSSVSGDDSPAEQLTTIFPPREAEGNNVLAEVNDDQKAVELPVQPEVNVDNNGGADNGPEPVALGIEETPAPAVGP